MATSLTSNPNLTYLLFESISVSTQQIVYEFNENDLVSRPSFVLQIDFDGYSDIPTLYYFPDSSGDIYMNLGMFMQQYMYNNNLTYMYYRLSYTPTWDGGSDAPVNTPYSLAIYSSMGIGVQHSPNMWDYVLKTEQAAKAMTSLTQPKLWNGWSRLIGHITQSAWGVVDLIIRELDINKQLLQNNNTTNIISLANRIVYQQLSSYYPSDPDAYYLGIKIQQTATDLSEELIFSLESECENPVMIQWLNKLGAFDQWLFQFEQTIQETAGQGNSWHSQKTLPLNTIEKTKHRTSHRKYQVMILKAENLTQNELQHLHTIKESDVVELFLSKDGDSIVPVRVVDGFTDDFTTGKNNYIFSLKIELPDNIDFFEIKEY